MTTPKTKTKGAKLTWLQEAFCRAYVTDPTNQTQAAKKAGYKGNDNTLAKWSHELLKDAKIVQEIDRLRAENAELQQIDVGWCLKQAVKGHKRCIKKDETNAKGYLDQVARMTGAFEADNRQRQTQIGMIIM